MLQNWYKEKPYESKNFQRVSCNRCDYIKNHNDCQGANGDLIPLGFSLKNKGKKMQYLNIISDIAVIIILILYLKDMKKIDKLQKEIEGLKNEKH